MLNPSALASSIVSSLQGKSNSSEVMRTLGMTISDYLCNNTTVIFSWIGMQPGTPPLPDPVVTFNANSLVGSFVCSPTNATSAMQNGILLGEQIRQGISNLKIVPPAGFILPLGTFANAAPILLTPTQSTSGYEHWLKWSTTIITTFMTYINPTPLPGSHGSFIGSPGAVMTSIF